MNCVHIIVSVTRSVHSYGCQQQLLKMPRSVDLIEYCRGRVSISVSVSSRLTVAESSKPTSNSA